VRGRRNNVPLDQVKNWTIDKIIDDCVARSCKVKGEISTLDWAKNWSIDKIVDSVARSCKKKEKGRGLWIDSRIPWLMKLLIDCIARSCKELQGLQGVARSCKKKCDWLCRSCKRKEKRSTFELSWDSVNRQNHWLTVLQVIARSCKNGVRNYITFSQIWLIVGIGKNISLFHWYSIGHQ